MKKNKKQPQNQISKSQKFQSQKLQKLQSVQSQHVKNGEAPLRDQSRQICTGIFRLCMQVLGGVMLPGEQYGIFPKVGYISFFPIVLPVSISKHILQPLAKFCQPRTDQKRLGWAQARCLLLAEDRKTTSKLSLLAKDRKTTSKL